MNSMYPPEYDLLLSAAQKNNSPQIVHLVQRKGVPVGHANAVGQTALHIAAMWGNVEAVTTLLELGAPVNARNQLANSTPLHMAANGRNPSRIEEVIDVLLAHNADRTALDAMDRSPADMTDNFQEKLSPDRPEIVKAIEAGDVDRVQRAVSNLGVNAQTFQYRGTPAAELIIGKMVKLENDQVDAWVDPLELVMTTETPLENGTDSPLYDLVSLKQPTSPRLIKLLLPHLPPDNWKMMHKAARQDSVDTVKYCIGCLQSDPNLAGQQGMTALHFAARSGRMAVLNYLLSLPQIDRDVEDSRGKKPLFYAQVNENQDAIAALEAVKPSL